MTSKARVSLLGAGEVLALEMIRVPRAGRDILINCGAIKMGYLLERCVGEIITETDQLIDIEVKQRRHNVEKLLRGIEFAIGAGVQQDKMRREKRSNDVLPKLAKLRHVVW
jgi:hypothetical protein